LITSGGGPRCPVDEGREQQHLLVVGERGVRRRGVLHGNRGGSVQIGYSGEMIPDVGSQ
jgi:hypothetical protein